MIDNSGTISILFCFVMIMNVLGKKEGEMNEVAGFIIFMITGLLCWHLIFDNKS